MDVQALILAGGKSKRMNFNKNKIFMDMCGKSILQHIIDNLLFANIKDILLVANVENYKQLSKLSTFKKVIIQPILNGTGGAVLSAINYLNKNKKTLIINGDGPILNPSFIQGFINNDAKLVLLTNNIKISSTNGRVLRNKNNEVQSIVEFKDATNGQKLITEGNAGVYLFDTKKLIKHITLLNNNNEQHELYLTDLVKIFVQNNYSIKTVLMPTRNNYLSVNTMREYTMQNIKMQHDIKCDLIEKGVLLVQPNTIYVQNKVDIGTGTIIYGGVHLLNDVTIGENCIIYPNCVLKNCIIPNNTIVKPGSIIIN